MPALADSPNFRRLLERRRSIFQELHALVSREGAKFVSDRTGQWLILHPSLSEPGKWQLTHFTSTGEPTGHDVHATFEDGYCSARGISGAAYGPPAGSFDYVRVYPPFPESERTQC